MIDLTVPLPGFDEHTYLASNADVASEVRKGSLVSGWQHVLLAGYREARAGLASDVKAQVEEYWRRFEERHAHRVPPPGLRHRVHGSPDYPGYRLVGDRIAHDIDAVLAASDTTLSDGSRILDFGCGCGRVICHLKHRHAGWQMIGCDIDAEAIAWCQEHLGDVARFEANRVWPPLTMDSNTFDMVYAISVFTHLPEDMQFAWLDELERVAKPGGLLLLSVHPVALAQGAIDASSRNRGYFYSAGAGTDGLPGFYQTSFHSREYILENWSRHVDILDIIPRRINAHQDLVVARRRPGTSGKRPGLAPRAPILRRLLGRFRGSGGR